MRVGIWCLCEPLTPVSRCWSYKFVHMEWFLRETHPSGALMGQKTLLPVVLGDHIPSEKEACACVCAMATRSDSRRESLWMPGTPSSAAFKGCFVFLSNLTICLRRAKWEEQELKTEYCKYETRKISARIPKRIREQKETVRRQKKKKMNKEIIYKIQEVLIASLKMERY